MRSWLDTAIVDDIFWNYETKSCLKKTIAEVKNEYKEVKISLIIVTLDSKLTVTQMLANTASNKAN